MGDCDKDLLLELRSSQPQLQEEEKKKIEQVEEEVVVVKREFESSSSSSAKEEEIDHDSVTVESATGDVQDRNQEDNPEADPISTIETLDGELKDLTSLQGGNEDNELVEEEISEGVETLGGKLGNLSLVDDITEQHQQQGNPEGELEIYKTLEDGELEENLISVEESGNREAISREVNSEVDTGNTKTLDGEFEKLICVEGSGKEEDGDEAGPNGIEIVGEEESRKQEDGNEAGRNGIEIVDGEESGKQEDGNEAGPNGIEIVDGELGDTSLEELSNLKQEDNLGGDADTTSNEILDGELKTTSSVGDNGNKMEGGVTAFKEEKQRKVQYPVRPGEPDCVFYLRTKICGYGSQCRFNHPVIRKKQVDKEEKENVENHARNGQQVYEVVNEKEKEKDRDREQYSESTRPTLCKYYLSGSCVFGKGCKNLHPREKTVAVPAKEFNFLGLPIRPGAIECPFFMRTGACKYATNCRYHHPDPTDTGESDSPAEYQKGGSVMLPESGSSQPPITPWSFPRISNGATPYMDASASYSTVMSVPNQVVHQNMQWSGYQVPVNPVYPSEGNPGQRHAPAMNISTRKADDSFMNHQQRMAFDEFPERPGQLECQYFMKTGDCKYRSTCKFHHPKNRSTNSSAYRPTSMPQRPDQVLCVHYSRHGICKYGPGCKFYHPTPVL